MIYIWVYNWIKNWHTRLTSASTISWPELTFLFKVEFQWFFMLLSVLPGRYGAILAHLLPWTVCCSAKVMSSSRLHSPFLMVGSRWLCHLQWCCHQQIYYFGHLLEDNALPICPQSGSTAQHIKPQTGNANGGMPLHFLPEDLKCSIYS